jgi:hypothetical protein
MKSFLVLLVTSVLSFSTIACSKDESTKPAASEPAKATTTAPAAKKDEGPRFKTVCKDVKDRSGNIVKGPDGKPKQDCKEIRVHRKLEGKEIPSK